MKNYICKRASNGSIIILDKNALNGLSFNPKNSSKYGIAISKMIIVSPDIVKKLLIKSTKRKLDKFIRLLASLADDDDATDASLREALNDLSRYRNIVEYKYNKYLDEKYKEQLIAKIDILEGEIKKKILRGVFCSAEEGIIAGSSYALHSRQADAAAPPDIGCILLAHIQRAS